MSTSRQASVEFARDFVDETTAALGQPWAEQLLGSERTAEYQAAIEGLGVLAVKTSKTGSMAAQIIQESKTGIYVVGLKPTQESAQWSVELPAGRPEDTPVTITNADIRRGRDEQGVSSKHILVGPSTGIIAVYADVKLDPIERFADNIYQLTNAMDVSPLPEEDPRVHSARVARKASRAEFRILNSWQGYDGFLLDWVRYFEAQGDEFDEEAMAAELDGEFPNPDQITVRRAITARTLTRIYGPEISDDLIAAYQRHGYLENTGGTDKETEREEPVKELLDRPESPFSPEDWRWIKRQGSILAAVGLVGAGALVVLEAQLEARFGYGMRDFIGDGSEHVRSFIGGLIDFAQGVASSSD